MRLEKANEAPAWVRDARRIDPRGSATVGDGPVIAVAEDEERPNIVGTSLVGADIGAQRGLAERPAQRRYGARTER